MGKDENKARIIEFLLSNTDAKFDDVKDEIKLKIDRYFPGGIREAYKQANLTYPGKRTRKQMKQQVIRYIQKNPKTANTVTILQDLNIGIPRVFGTLKDAYESAGVEYHSPKAREEKRQIIVDCIKESPLLTYKELDRKFKVSVFKLFNSMDEIYSLADVPNPGKRKFRSKRQLDVINYIKNNPSATQHEINRDCRTHVQSIFERGIIGAFFKAGVKYPFARRRIYGCMDKKIKSRSYKFEKEVIKHLSKIGKVKSQVRTISGYVDALLEVGQEKFAVEIKDYRVKQISMSEIKQLLRYLDDLGYKQGILICNKKKKDNLYIGDKRIQILTFDELKGVHSSVV